MKNDKEPTWFLFSNQDEALDHLKEFESVENTEIVISEYIIDYTLDAITATATFIKVNGN
jgi:hypothetical protein